MKRYLCVVLALIMSISLMTPFTIGAADVRDEFIRTDKSTYEVGEFIEVQYEFDGIDPTRWICFYKGSVSAGNMVYAMTAGALRASNAFAPIVTVGMNGTDAKSLTQPGTYIMKAMYVGEGDDYNVVSNFVEGDKSGMTYTFSVQAGGSTVPSIQVAETEVEKGSTLKVQFEGVVNTLQHDSLRVELQDGQGVAVKSRVLWNGLYYAGKSGELVIPLVNVQPGEYTVQLICSNAEYVLGNDAVKITVTGQSDAGKWDAIFPEDLFRRPEICEQYFANADKPGNKYEVIDGEYVMHVPLHPGNDYMYTWDPIPYSKFTVSFDFLLHIVPDSQYSDEMDFLFGMPSAGLPFHQATLDHKAGSLYLLHYKHTGTMFTPYEFDTMFIDVYEKEVWMEFTAEITPDEVSIYINGEWWATFEDTADCIGTNGYIGLRGGSTGGWEVKNLKVTPGTLEEQASGNVSIETPTREPSETPSDIEDDSTPEADPTSYSTSDVEEYNTEENSSWIWLLIVIVVVVACAGFGVFMFLRKKKHK